MKRGGRTYFQKPVVRDGYPALQRTSTYFHNGHAVHSTRYYHGHYIGHVHYHCYVHYWHYDPWFWGFYFAPFPAPWYYHWWWVSAPWYYHWGWYYDPYDVYYGPSYWVTDYTIARMLEDEYERGYEAGAAAAEGTAITEPVKEQLREQVDDTAQAFQESRAILLEEALADPDYLFIVDTPLSVTTEQGAACALSGGDIIKPAGPGVSDVPVASMVVVTAKGDECGAGSVVNVSYTDLQEMLNTFAATVDDGLNELKRQQPKDGE